MSFNPLLQALRKVTEHFDQENNKEHHNQNGELVNFQAGYLQITITFTSLSTNCSAVIATYADDRRRELVGLGLLGMTVLGKKHFPLSDPFEKRIESKFLISLKTITCNQKFLNVQVREDLGK